MRVSESKAVAYWTQASSAQIPRAAERTKVRMELVSDVTFVIQKSNSGHALSDHRLAIETSPKQE